MSTLNLPYSEACERNKGPILEQLQRLLPGPQQVFEVGSGTGQHAEHFARQLPYLHWQCSEQPEHLPGLALRLQQAGLSNLPAPLAFQVGQSQWPATKGSRGFDVVYSANTAHIMSWAEVTQLFAQLGQQLQAGAQFLLYGPFKQGGSYTSPSNAEFDLWLKARYPKGGQRNLEDLQALGTPAGLQLTEQLALPANNQLLVWRKVPASATNK